MKQTFKYAVKLFLYTLFSAFASFMVAMSFSAVFSQSKLWAFYTFTQIFNLIILVTLVWQTVYSIGFKDSNMVKTGHIKEDIYKGFKFGVLAQIPWLIFLCISVVLNIRFSVYRLFNSTYFWFLTAIAGKSEFMRMSPIKICGFALMLLIVPIISGVVYILGYKGIDILSKFIYKKQEEK